MDDLTPEEKLQKRVAVQTLLATSFPRNFIKEGRARAVDKLKKRAKSKADYNKERKRDFRYGKAEDDKKVEEVADAIERDGMVSYAALGAAVDDPYFRNFDNALLRDTVRQIHPKLHTYNKVMVIDIAGQRVGNDGLDTLLGQMDRCPVEVLGLTDNLIDDTGLEMLSIKLRSMSRLRELYLNQNRFRDLGVQYIFEENKYSPTLEVINLARNVLGLRSAYFLGLMFTKERKAKLHTLILGGRIGRQGFGDDFIRCLASFFALPGSRSPLKLAFPEAEVNRPGLMSLSLLVACCPELRELNIERNRLGCPILHDVLTTTLTLHTGMRLIHEHQAGLSQLDRRKVQESLVRKVRPDWRQMTTLAYYLARETYDSRLIRLAQATALFNSPSGVLAPWAKAFHGEAPALPLPTAETCRPKLEIYQVIVDSRMVLTQPQLKSFLPSLPSLIQLETKRLISSLNQIAYLGFALWDIVDESVEITSIRGIKSTIASLLERKRVVAVTLDATITDLDKYASIAKAKKRKGKGKGRSKGFANSTDGVLMSLQDCADQLRLYSTDIEKLIGMIHKSVRERTNLNNVLDLVDEARDLLPYQSLGPSGFFAHYMFIVRPYEDHFRKRREEQRKAREALEQKIAEKNARKLKGRKVVGPRFQIGDGVGLLDADYWANLVGAKVEEHIPDKEDDEEQEEILPPTVFRWADAFAPQPEKVVEEPSFSLADFASSTDDMGSSIDVGPQLSPLYRVGRTTMAKYYEEDSMMVQRMFMHGRDKKKYLIHRRPAGTTQVEMEEVRGEAAIAITRSHIARSLIRIEDKLRAILAGRQEGRAKEMQV